MKTLKQFILEVNANIISKRSKMPEETTIDNPYVKREVKGATVHKSISPDHVVYHKRNGNENTYHWVHRRTGAVDFRMDSTTQKGEVPNEVIHNKILSTSRHNGPSIGHHAYHDIMSGRLGEHGIMIGDDQSKGAVALRNNIKREYPEEIEYNTFDPRTGEGKHLTRGVSASKDTPESLSKAIKPIVIVAMMNPKNRIKIKK